MSRPLTGNRLVLAGTVLYLLEWVAIIAGGVGVPLGAAASTHDLTAAYSGQAEALGWAAGWFCVVEFGRVVLIVGLRAALASPGRENALMDLAVAAMSISVALEVAAYAVAAGASWALERGGSLTTTRALDAVAFVTSQTIYGPLGVSVLCAAVAMWRSSSFAKPLCALGIIAGVAFTTLGLALVGPRFASTADAVSAAALPMWIWMVWTGVVVWRTQHPRRGVHEMTAPDPLRVTR